MISGSGALTVNTATRQIRACPELEVYFTEILFDYGKINALCKDLEPLVKLGFCDTTPEFFLASVSAKSWKPCIVTVRRHGELIGALYAKDRKFGGLATGLIYGDATLNAMVMARPHERAAVFCAALRALLARRRTLGLRLQLPPDSYEWETLPPLIQNFRMEYAAVPSTNHLVLPLAATYEEFLGRLGARTRRNFRYYRRKFESEGHAYVENLPFEEFRLAAHSLLRQKVVGADCDGIERALAMFSRARNPMLAGLRAKQGHWLGLLGGWAERARHIIFFQMNSDRHHSKSSLCLVLRSYFFESLIRKNIRSVVFWAGVGEPLNRYSMPVPTLSVYLDKPQKIWRVMRHMIASGLRRLPEEIAWRAYWLVPNANSEQTAGLAASVSEVE